MREVVRGVEIVGGGYSSSALYIITASSWMGLCPCGDCGDDD